jgi:C4-dicarboxylate-specific signal transduction histidine kinase
VERLRQDRLDALGGMATTLAHEINQPLSATATYLKVARRLLDKSRPPGGADVMDVLDKATAQTLRAGRIVTSLRDLVQRGEPDKTIVSMHALIHEAQDSVLAESALSGVAVRLDCRALRDKVVADRTQLRQVLRSLIRNAVDAVQFADRRELVVATSNPDDLVIRVDVTDTGCGISADDDCFEPFTTTKAKGMGIGLSISRSIIEAHYGRIWARTNAGGGAVFSFTLPLQDPEIDL